SPLDRDQLVDRFKDKGEKVQLDLVASTDDEERDKKPVPDIHKKAEVWEIWDKRRKKVIWLAPGTPGLILDMEDDPYGLPGFFPQPRPIEASTTTDRRPPVCDYRIIRDLYTELDTLTYRISRLLRAIRVGGAYAGSDKDVISKLLDDG